MTDFHKPLRNNMKDLIERLEKATCPDRKLEHDIANAVLDLEWRPYSERRRVRKLWGYKRGTDHVLFYSEASVPEYTASLDAALTLVPKEFYEAALFIGQNSTGVELSLVKGDGGACVGGHRAPAVALCIAALKARAAQEQTT